VTRKKILILLGSMCLALAMIAMACAGPAPTPTPAPTTPAPTTPATAEPLEITLQSPCASGGYETCVTHIKDAIESASDGRIQVTITWEGEIVAIPEQMAALRDGIFDMMYACESYWKGQIPEIDIWYSISQAYLHNPQEVWAMWEHFGWGELMAPEYAKWNAYRISSNCFMPGAYFVSKKYVPTVDDLKGMKIRVGNTSLAGAVEKAGAGAVWMPGGEVYTALASGLVDGAFYGSAADHYGLGWAEVTDYWVRPASSYCITNTMLANSAFWDALSESDKALIKEVCDVGGLVHANAGFYDNEEGFKKAQQEQGVEILWWDASSVAQWREYYNASLPRPESEIGEGFLKALNDFLAFKGLEPAMSDYEFQFIK